MTNEYKEMIMKSKIWICLMGFILNAGFLLADNEADSKDSTKQGKCETSFNDKEGEASQSDAKPSSKEFVTTVRKAAEFASDSATRKLVKEYGLSINNVTWEDTGRYKGSSVGPNISDMTIEVHTRDQHGNVVPVAQPVIRHDNFNDKTADVDPDKFFIRVGNEKGEDLKVVSLREYLSDIRSYLSDKDSWKGEGMSLLSPRDSAVQVSAQSAILPVPEGETVSFNPVLFNYQSSEGNPAVLTILVTPNGTSATIIDNTRDKFTPPQFERFEVDAKEAKKKKQKKSMKSKKSNKSKGKKSKKKNKDKNKQVAPWMPNPEDVIPGPVVMSPVYGGNSARGQRLFHNQNGQKASLTAVGTGNDIKKVSESNPETKSGEAGANGIDGKSMVMLIQIPLKHDSNGMFGGGIEEMAYALDAMPTAMRATTSLKEVEIGYGEVEGPFVEIDGQKIERDHRFPIRVTVQQYVATEGRKIMKGDMEVIQDFINAVYKGADAVGSLVTEGKTGRVTEHNVQPIYRAWPWWGDWYFTHFYKKANLEDDKEATVVGFLKEKYGDHWQDFFSTLTEKEAKELVEDDSYFEDLK